MTTRKQLSMVLPTALINAIKQQAHDRGQSITAYISALVRADLEQPPETTPSLIERLNNLECRLERLEQRLNLPCDDANAV